MLRQVEGSVGRGIQPLVRLRETEDTVKLDVNSECVFGIRKLLCSNWAKISWLERFRF